MGWSGLTSHRQFYFWVAQNTRRPAIPSLLLLRLQRWQRRNEVFSGKRSCHQSQEGQPSPRQRVPPSQSGLRSHSTIHTDNYTESFQQCRRCKGYSSANAQTRHLGSITDARLLNFISSMFFVIKRLRNWQNCCSAVAGLYIQTVVRERHYIARNDFAIGNKPHVWGDLVGLLMKTKGSIYLFSHMLRLELCHL